MVPAAMCSRVIDHDQPLSERKQATEEPLWQNERARLRPEVAMKHSPGFLKIVGEAKRTIRECTPADVKARLDRGDSVHFIDVREDLEFAADHAAGARHIGRGVLERDIEGLIPDREAEIVLYCGGGFRSALAAETLEKMGYRQVISMDGGMHAWREAGYPVEKG
jgi:rhodanese-related sulfurtransferase